MNMSRLHIAAEALTKHTGHTYFAKHASGFYSMQRITDLGATVTILCRKNKKDLFDAACDYIHGFHEGKRNAG
jgi:hypothetical protein